MRQEIKRRKEKRTPVAPVKEYKLTAEELMLYRDGGTLGSQKPKRRRA